MAKFSGKIGYVMYMETTNGIFTPTVEERNYTGDVIRNSRKWEKTANLNDNLQVDNKISIVADPFAYQNLNAMKYVELMGVSWRITNVEIQRPRLILTIGDLYNGPTI